MRLAWATDLHLEFCDDVVIDAFCHRVPDGVPDALIVTGDIGQAPSVIKYLARLEAALPCPIYFVLGNHDFYRGAIGPVRSDVERYLRGTVAHGGCEWQE